MTAPDHASALPPTLVLLPGLHGTRNLFQPLLAHIPSTLPTRLIDYPTDHPLSRAQLLDHLDHEIADLPAMILLAESFSGPLAIEYAATNPTRIKALILCVTFVQPPVPRILCYLASLPVLLHCPLPTIGIRTFLSGFRAPREVVHDLRREVNRMHPWTLAHRIRQAAWVDARAALARCPMPILCLAATRDRLVGPRSLRRIKRIRPDIPTHTLDAPHLLLQTKPAESWQIIDRFLQTNLHVSVPSVSSTSSVV